MDLDQTFAMIVKPMVFRALLAIALFYEQNINEIDIETAFLYGIIDQLLYTKILHG